jgi:hypothetical protein
MPRPCNTSVYLRPCQPSWVPWMCDLPGLVCCKALPACSGHPEFYVGNEGLFVGCAPNGPAKYLWVLGRYMLETFLRSACLGWLCQTLCSYARYLGVSTLHTFKMNKFLVSSSTNPGHRNFSYDVIDNFFVCCTFQDPAGYPRILNNVGLFDVGTPTRPPRGRPCQTPCSYARRSGCLYASIDQDHDSVFFSSRASNQPCCLLQCSGTTLRVCLRCPLIFFVVPTC